MVTSLLLAACRASPRYRLPACLLCSAALHLLFLTRRLTILAYLPITIKHAYLPGRLCLNSPNAFAWRRRDGNDALVGRRR